MKCKKKIRIDPTTKLSVHCASDFLHNFKRYLDKYQHGYPLKYEWLWMNYKSPLAWWSSAVQCCLFIWLTIETPCKVTHITVFLYHVRLKKKSVFINWSHFQNRLHLFMDLLFINFLFLQSVTVFHNAHKWKNRPCLFYISIVWRCLLALYVHEKEKNNNIK